MVLEPLVVERREELPGRVGAWKNEISSLELPEEQRRELQELLEYIILQRFPSLSREELRTMLQLTPLEETVAGREVREMGRQEGWLIGQIQLLQEMLELTPTPMEELDRMPTTELEIMLRDLKARRLG